MEQDTARLGRFVIYERLGSGGLGDVFAAYDPQLDRKVAVKLLRSEAANGELGHANLRLQREAQAVARLRHENVVTVYDIGTTADGAVFMAMEIVEGQTLRDWARTARTWREVRDVMLRVGGGLLAAHQAGIVHRDIKPLNIMVTPSSRPVLLDFGLSKAPNSEPTPPNEADPSLLSDEMTQPHIMLGTPPYMARELWYGMPASKASDQFSFCVTFFEILFSARPFSGANAAQRAASIAKGPKLPRSTRSVPRWLIKTIVRGLAANPSDRWPSMAELLDALTRDKQRRRRGTLASLVLLPILSGGIAAASVTSRPDPTSAQLDEARQTVEVARRAADAGLFLFPPPDAPDRPTAYSEIIALESMDGPVQAVATQLARELRVEFAETLVGFGDEYSEKDLGSPFALDFYSIALVFDPANVRARDRSVLRPSELAALRKSASSREFSDFELAAFEPMIVLADRDPARAVRRARRIRTSSPLSISTKESLCEIVGVENDINEVLATSGMMLVPQEALSSANTFTADEPTAIETRAEEPTPDAPKRNQGKQRELVAAGKTALRQGRLDKAARHFHSALEADPRSVGAIEGLADVAFERGEYGEAAKLARRAVKRSPRSQRLRIKLGDAYFKELRYDEARTEYDAAAAAGSKTARERLARLQRITGG